jgi:hypothetical protein
VAFKSGDEVQKDETIACMGEQMHTQVWLERLIGRDHIRELCINGRIILKWVLKA